METRVGGVPKDVIGFPEAAGTIHMFQGGERAARDILGRGDDPLNSATVQLLNPTQIQYVRMLSMEHR